MKNKIACRNTDTEIIFEWDRNFIFHLIILPNIRSLISKSIDTCLKFILPTSGIYTLRGDSGWRLPNALESSSAPHDRGDKKRRRCCNPDTLQDDS